IPKIVTDAVGKCIQFIVGLLKLGVPDGQHRIGNVEFVGLLNRRDNFLFYPRLPYKSENMSFVYRIYNSIHISISRQQDPDRSWKLSFDVVKKIDSHFTRHPLITKNDTDIRICS